MVESVIVPAAETMPPKKYDFAPPRRVQGMPHVRAAIERLSLVSAILGEKPPVETGGENGPDRVEGKDCGSGVYVKASFA